MRVITFFKVPTLIIFIILLLSHNSFGEEIIIENFDDYSLGLLIGQGNWTSQSGNGPIVQNNQIYGNVITSSDNWSNGAFAHLNYPFEFDKTMNKCYIQFTGQITDGSGNNCCALLYLYDTNTDSETGSFGFGLYHNPSQGKDHQPFIQPPSKWGSILSAGIWYDFRLEIDWSKTTSNGFGLACLKYKQSTNTEWTTEPDLSNIELNINEPKNLNAMYIRNEGLSERVGKIDNVIINYGDSYSNNLVAHYSFNENSNDLSGNNNHGIVNGATLATDRFEIQNNSYYFDGINDYILINDSLSVNFVGLTQISFSTWIKTESELGGIIEQCNYGTSFRLGVLNGKAVFYYENKEGGWIIIHGDTTINDNKWHHIAVVMTGKEINLFVDAKLDNNSIQPNPIISKGRFTFGMRVLGTDWFNGFIDDIRIYKRSLTDNEICELYFYNRLGYGDCNKNLVIGTIATSSQILGYTANVGGITVTAKPYNLSSVTDINGQFQIIDIPTGEYVLQVESDYFQTITKLINVKFGLNNIGIIEVLNPICPNICNQEEFDSLSNEYKLLSSTFLTLNSTYQALSCSYNQCIKNIENLIGENEELMFTNEDMNEAIAQKNIIITQLNETITSLYTEEQLQNIISEKNKEIRELNQYISEINSYKMILSSGWHLISSLQETSLPETIPNGCIEILYKYSNGAYIQANKLTPNYGYWVKIKKYNSSDEDCNNCELYVKPE